MNNIDLPNAQVGGDVIVTDLNGITASNVVFGNKMENSTITMQSGVSASETKPAQSGSSAEEVKDGLRPSNSTAKEMDKRKSSFWKFLGQMLGSVLSGIASAITSVFIGR